ncbi:uncharacterized protein EKO05_0005421 [Ascochyta rabiei]|uniref:uncharacterized protein n=1 Tax=Didymella rabiei TaxID=5454 RepID=UPI00190011C5|nr:uncharacterized protein EKO05_0005421 [Ascochyta rabiei]UPX14951.1 hypothetical protein EKO05_0005421 [Ascochyta rabiei]
MPTLPRGEIRFQKDYLAHVQGEHPVVASNTDEISLLKIARQPMLQVPAQDYPCCSEWETRLRDRAIPAISFDTTHDSVCVQSQLFKRHLALFAAPVSSVYAGDGDSNTAAQQKSDPRSDNDNTYEDGHWFASLDIEQAIFGLVNQAPFTVIRSFSQGPWIVVEKVISTIDSRVYTVKRTRSVNKQDESSFQSVQAEIDVLKRIIHDHVISYLGGFSDRSQKGYDIHCILFFDAETNLWDYLEDTPTSKFRELRTFFGCLATGLGYLHTQKIRHSDIKLMNILVNHGHILISGFGMALDFPARTMITGTTTGANNFARSYTAPEVIRHQFVNTKSDMWALGKTILEIIAVLKGRTFEDFNSSSYEYKHNMLDQYLRALPNYLEQLQEMGLATDNAPLKRIRTMLSEDPEMRSDASSLAALITCVDEGQFNSFCGVCCLSSPEMPSD